MHQFALNLKLKSFFDANDFLIGSCNNQAVELINSWPNWRSNIAYIFGEKSCGKTFLGNIWKQMTDATIIKLKDIDATFFEHSYNNYNFFIDDLNLELNNDTNQELQTKLFHLYNFIKAQNGSLLICSSTSINELTINLPDLTSRLKTSIVAKIDSLDESFLEELLKQLFNKKQISITEDIIKYLVVRVERTFNSAITIVDEIDELSLSLKKPVTLGLVRQLFTSKESNLL